MALGGGDFRFLGELGVDFTDFRVFGGIPWILPPIRVVFRYFLVYGFFPASFSARTLENSGFGPCLSISVGIGGSMGVVLRFSLQIVVQSSSKI